MRSHLRERAPSIGKINQTWGIDLTGKQDIQGQLHFILGILNHGSRKLLGLLVSTKHSLQLAEHLQQAIAQYGKPQRIRSDNERCFTSPSFNQCLHTSSIRHQRIDLHCPWQNGRIERLFGTLKQQLNQIHIQSAEHLQSLLDQFKHWYNTIRLHQHLGYQTPQEVWQQQKPFQTPDHSRSQAHMVDRLERPTQRSAVVMLMPRTPPNRVLTSSCPANWGLITEFHPKRIKSLSEIPGLTARKLQKLR